MISWLLVAELVSRSGKTLSQLVGERIAAYPCSGEINYRVNDVAGAIGHVLEHYLPQNPVIDHTDGVSAEFAAWRFNLRCSNTEPLLRGLENIEIPFVGAASAAKQKDIAEAAPTLCMVYL